MPHFNAPLARHSALHGDLFVLDVVDPSSSPTNPNTIGAAVAKELYTTRMSPQIADLFGASAEGDKIEVQIRQCSYITMKIHEFDPIEVEVRFAKPRLGPYYLCLGQHDLEKYFDVFLCTPHPGNPDNPFILLETKPVYMSMCRQLTV